MECAEAEIQPITDAEAEVVFWRAEALRRAGYDAKAVLRLARRSDIDLHLAVGLLDSGCAQHTALRILL